MPAAKAKEYHDYLLVTGFQDYATMPGNRSILLKREEDDVTHYCMLTYWDDIQAIKKFAGEDHERGPCYPASKDFLPECEPLIIHYEVLEYQQVK